MTIYQFYTFICTLNKKIFLLFGPNYLQIRILFIHKIYKYWIPNTIRSWNFMNTEYRTVTTKSTNTEEHHLVPTIDEYRIIEWFGANLQCSKESTSHRYKNLPNTKYQVCMIPIICEIVSQRPDFTQGVQDHS